MDRDLGQITVEGLPVKQHQFFPGGGIQQLPPNGRDMSAVDRSTESSWSSRQTGTHWDNSHPQEGGGRSINRSDWNANSWRWDGAALSAQRISRTPHGSGLDSSRDVTHRENGRQRGSADLGLQLDVRATGTAEPNHQVIHIDDDETEVQGQTFFGRHTPSPPSNEPNPYNRGDESPEDDGPLSLKLGGSSYAYEHNGAGKRPRSSSPQSQIPTCQVDGCTADLSRAKDYHRRHKVCEAHSKAPTTLVSRVRQRFCQQCSRFHPLDKFDEDKRSCRRRLAGHNKRRRKTQPDAPTPRVEDQAGVKNSDLLALLGMYSQLRGPLEQPSAAAAANDQDILLQCLRQAGNLNLPNSTLEGLTRAASSWNQLTRNSDLAPPQIDPRLLASQLTGHAPQQLAPQDALAMLLQNNLKHAARMAQENIYGRAGFNGNMNGGPLPYPVSSADASVSHAVPQINNERTPSAPGLSLPSSLRVPGIVPGALDPAQLLTSIALSLHSSLAAQTASPGLAANGYGMAQSAMQAHPEQTSIDTRNLNLRFDRNQENAPSVHSQVGRQRQSTQNGVSHPHKRSFLDLQQSQAPLQRPSIDLQQPPPSEQYSDASETGSGSGSGSGSGVGSDHQSPGTPNRDLENSRISFKLFDKHPTQFPEGLRSQVLYVLSYD